MNLEVVGVLGAGTMGIGVAHVFAEHGYKVIVVDNKQQALFDFDSLLQKSYQAQRLLGQPKSELSEIRNRIVLSNDINLLSDCSYLIENTTESFEHKSELLKKINPILPKTCLIAINTSCIPITSLSQNVDSPERMVGIHFMNPVPMKSFVEIIKTPISSAETLDRVKAMLKSIGKSGKIVRDNPGFVINRVFMVTVNEAIKVYEEKLCDSPNDIDELFSKCLGQKMGPLMTADLIGLDTILFSLNVLYEESKNEMYRPANLLVELVNEGKFGPKTGEGIYQYKTSLIA